jgi:hypothetical protein
VHNLKKLKKVGHFAANTDCGAVAGLLKCGEGLSGDKLRNRPVRDPADHHCPDFLRAYLGTRSGEPTLRRIMAPIAGWQGGRMTG